ncbi:hypothetical protein [Rhodopseudomonas palustris]
MDIDLYGNRLRVLSWMMRCVAQDPTFPPPDGIDVLDAIDVTLAAIDTRADELDELAVRLRRHMHRIDPPLVPPEAYVRREDREEAKRLRRQKGEMLMKKAEELLATSR